jgi:hypothetical protein
MGDASKFTLEMRPWMTMQSVLRIPAGALTLSLMSACTSSLPRATPTQQAPSGNQLAGAGTSVPTQASAVEPQTDVDIAMRKRGYQPATFRGERVYCRKEALTGSNLQNKVCRTAKDIEDQERAGKDVLNGNRPAGCLPKTACN